MALYGHLVRALIWRGKKRASYDKSSQGSDNRKNRKIVIFLSL